jgi:hypothetical protein
VDETDRIAIRRLADQFAGIDRRLRALETAPQLPFSSVRDGFTTWRLSSGEAPRISIGATADATDVSLTVWDNDENAALIIGTVLDGDDVGIRVENPDKDQSGTCLNAQRGVLVVPLLSCAWQQDPAVTHDTNGRAQVSSGSYTRSWTAVLPIGTGDIYSSVAVQLGAGVTSADARIRALPFANLVTGSEQTVHEETGITGSVFLGGLPWTIPDSILTPARSPVGTLVQLEIEVRVAGGAGNVLVAPHDPVANYPV